jgi:hypothetical protein
MYYFIYYLMLEITFYSFEIPCFFIFLFMKTFIIMCLFSMHIKTSDITCLYVEIVDSRCIDSICKCLLDKLEANGSK